MKTGIPPVHWASAAVGAYQADRKVFVLVDVGTESRARYIGIDLISNGMITVPDDFERDRIDRSVFGV